MKIKYAIMLAGLAVVFAAVSLWVFLSGGKSAKAVRAKFRLGGLMLTVTGLLTAANGCGPITPQVTCYDVAMPEYVDFSEGYKHEVKVGDAILFKVTELNHKAYTYVISCDRGELQRGGLELVDGAGSVVIADTDYRGYICLNIFGNDGVPDQEYYLGACSFMLE